MRLRQQAPVSCCIFPLRELPKRQYQKMETSYLTWTHPLLQDDPPHKSFLILQGIHMWNEATIILDFPSST